MFKYLNKQTRFYLFIYLFTVFSGAIRKWIVSSIAIGNIIFLIQLLTPFCFMLFNNWSKAFSPFKNKFVSFYFVMLVIMAINPLNLTIYHGILGIIIHFTFWYISFFYIENRDEFDVENLMPVFIIVGFFILVLAIIQYELPPDNFLNRYADESQVGNSIALVGESGKVRVTGTFSYLGGFNSYILFHGLLIWALIKIQYRPAITIILILFGLIGAFMSGSRGATGSYLLVCGGAIVSEYRSLNFRGFFSRLIIPGILLYLFLLLKGQFGFEGTAFEAYQNFDKRREQLKESGEEQRRILWDYRDLSEFRGKYPLLGMGLGSTYNGANATFGTSDYVKEYGYYENELTRLVLEGGFILLVLKMIMVIYFASRLYLPFIGKIIVCMITCSVIVPIVFNVYYSYLIFIGIVLIDKTYYMEKFKLQNPIRP